MPDLRPLSRTRRRPLLAASALATALTVLGSPAAAAAPAGEPGGEGYGGWRQATIGGGGYVMDVLPTTDPQVYYLHTDVGGFYRSDDAGESWRMLQAALPATAGNQEPAALAVDPRNPDRFLVATGQHWSSKRDGVFRSDDGGESYRQTLVAAFAGNGNERMWGRDMAVSPHDPDVVIAASMLDGVFRSDDFGTTWTNTGLGRINPTDVVFDEQTPGRVLLTSRPYDFYLLGNPSQKLRGGFFESLDDGRTWSEVPGVSPSPYEIVQLPGGDGDRWVGVFPPSVVRQSTDGGRTWAAFGEGLPVNPAAEKFDAGGAITPVASIDPSTFAALAVGPDFLLLGAGDGVVYRRGFDEKDWTAIRGTATAPESWYGNAGDKPGWVHFGKAISSLTIDPHKPDRWWMTDWYTLWKSDDGGQTWAYASDGIEVTVIHNVTQAPDDAGLVHMGMGDNGYFRSTDGGDSYRQNWNVITNNVKDVAVSPSRPQRLYALGPTEDGHWYSSHVFVSDDRGASWQAGALQGLIPSGERRINSLAADASDPETVYVAVGGTPSAGGGVFVSRDAGGTFTGISEGLPEAPLFRSEIWQVGRELAAGPDGTLVAASATTSRVFHRAAGADEWTEARFDHGVNAVAADPFHAGRFLIASPDAGVLRSSDGGATWSPLPVDSAFHVAYDSAVEGRVVVGTADGVRVSTDGGTTWTALSDELPNRRSNPVGFAGDRVIAGTSGAGMFWFPLTAEAAEPVTAATPTGR